MPRLWTFTQGQTEVDVTITEPPSETVNMTGVVPHPIIGRLYPRVQDSGQQSVERSFQAALWDDETAEDFLAILDSHSIITVISPDNETDYVRVQSRTRVRRPEGFWVFSVSVIRSV